MSNSINISPKLQEEIDSLEFNSSSLLFVDAENQPVTNTEFFVLEDAKKLSATAVYFRKFENRPSTPQILVFDFTTKNVSDEKLGEIHKNIWNSNLVSLAYIFTKTNVLILNTSKQPKEKEGVLYPVYLNEDVNTQLSIGASISKKIKEKYKAKYFDTGIFWELEENKKQFDSNESVYNKLLEMLIYIRNEFIKNSNLSEEIVNKLLLQSILVKYIEERIEEDKERKIELENYFKKNFGCKNFSEALEQGKALEVFENFNSEEKFNGNIFEWTEEDKQKIEGKKLPQLAGFIYGDTEKYGQKVLWKLYSFKYLPIELISRIYDELFGNRTEGVVYTPPHLVHFLVDECMPLDSDTPSTDFKVIDPSCGSGIFLVSAFKRLVQWRRITNPNEKPNEKVLRKLILENIYGTDIDEGACQLAVFSLSLAICDMLSPTEIWLKLKFDDLRKNNILKIDFFEYLKTNAEETFDLVIGNPPFNRGNKSVRWLENNRKKQKQVPIPQNQIALYFLEYSMELLKKGGLQCLIMPSGTTLYSSSTTQKYRNYFFERYNVAQIFDLTALARNKVLWQKADVATVVTFVEKTKPTDESILHITVRRTSGNNLKRYFELDEYDMHQVPKNVALEDNFVWKCNLMGGGRTYYVIKRLLEGGTLEDYLEEKREKHGWQYGEGYILGHKEGTILTEEQKEKYKKANYITDKPTLPTTSLTENGIIKENIYIQEEEYFNAPRSKNKNIYHTPHLLIKANSGKTTGKFSIALQKEGYLTFRDKITGIYAPKEDVSDLETIYETFTKLQTKTFQFFLYCHSGQVLVGKNTALLKEDIMNLPYHNELELYPIEKIIAEDVLKYWVDFLTSGENSVLAKPIKDKDFDKIIDSYADVFCEILNSVYKKNAKSFYYSALHKGKEYVGVAFKYGSKTSTKKILNLSEKDIEELIQNNYSDNVQYNRIIRIYKDNTIYLIKPNQLRYWVRSIAVRDADTTFAEIVYQRNSKNNYAK